MGAEWKRRTFGKGPPYWRLGRVFSCRTNELFPVLLLVVWLLQASEELLPPEAAFGLERDATRQLPSAGSRTAATGLPSGGGSHCFL